jgi:hypothetical protein
LLDDRQADLVVGLLLVMLLETPQHADRPPGNSEPVSGALSVRQKSPD